MNVELLKDIRKECLGKILEMYKKANAGHIGASLSCLDILTFLYFHQLKNEDRFILSKGHAALALYVVLAKKNIINESLLETFYGEGTLLAAHPPCSEKLNGISFGTGSLGHGLSLATGFALSNRFTGKSNHVYCILSEGDCNEGSTWEAALFASQHKLKNLFVIIDNNNLQGFGKSEDVLNLEPFLDKWKSFNFDVVSCEGHDFYSILSAFDTLNHLNSDKPKCIIAKTIKGNGVSFMENKLEWHYLPMDDEQFKQAILEVNSTLN
jgi:transketolase